MIQRYIPERIVRGCKTCPFYTWSHIDGDECEKLGWLNIDKNDNVAVNDQIDPKCPLATRDVIY